MCKSSLLIYVLLFTYLLGIITITRQAMHRHSTQGETYNSTTGVRLQEKRKVLRQDFKMLTDDAEVT